MRILLVAAWLAVAACGPSAETRPIIPEYGYEVVHTYPHDPLAFTEGLFYLNGFLYESTGINDQSSVRKVRLETGEVIEKRDVPGQYFGEGIVNWKDRLVAAYLDHASRLHLRPAELRAQEPVRVSRARAGR